jgi:co-chaperonin GroES (HSP10)
MKNKQKIEPLGSAVQIELEIKGATSKGIALPDSHDYIQERAKVLGVGPEVKDKRIKVGATVFFKSWALQTVIYDDEKGDFVEEKHCLAVVQ